MGILKQDYVSPTVQNDSVRTCHHSAASSTQELFLSRGVDEDTSARAETSEATSAAEQEFVLTVKGASADMAIYGRDGLEARLKSITTTAEASQSECKANFSISANIHVQQTALHYSRSDQRLAKVLACTRMGP